MDKHRILFVHNYYQFRGGEDVMADLDFALLKRNGHDVILFHRHNDEIKRYSIKRKSLLLLEPTFSIRSYREMGILLDSFKPDVIHINNFFPLISPSVIYTSLKKGIPVVMSLHDFRLICANGLLLRNSSPCEKCFRSPLFGVIYGCYRNSRLQTFPVFLMILLHGRILKTWERISFFIAPSEFVKGMFSKAGFRTDRIFVRPNYVEKEFVEFLERNFRDVRKENFAVFVGRLSEEKGIKILLAAWDILRKENIRLKLKIAGDGPLMPYVVSRARQNDLVEVLGFVSPTKVAELLAKAKFTVVPSICYEVFGRTVIESYAAGTPVIASKIGALKEIVIDEETGTLFDPDAESLAKKIKELCSLSDNRFTAWGENARRLFMEMYTEDRAYLRLIQVYDEARRKY